MTFYHYTSLEALKGILKEKPTENQELCFWATRYDCFEDTDEYLFGVDTLKRLLPTYEDKYNLQEDRRIAGVFEKDLIKRNVNLPYPYVISVSARNDNDHMWENYADHKKGVVLDLNIDAMFGKSNAATLYHIKQCLYEHIATEDELMQEIEKTYTEGSFHLLQNGKENAFFFLKEYPQIFTKLIAIYLLAFFAPRMKRKQFEKEEETRIILSAPPQEYAALKGIDDVKEAFKKSNIDFDIESVLKEIQNEKVRPDNGKFYREAFMPISFLNKIYVLDDEVKKKAEKVLTDRGYNNIPVEILK